MIAFLRVDKERIAESDGIAIVRPFCKWTNTFREPISSDFTRCNFPVSNPAASAVINTKHDLIAGWRVVCMAVCRYRSGG